MLWRLRRLWPARILLATSLIVVLYWRLVCPDTEDIPGSLDWVSGTGELDREEWRRIIEQPGADISGCSIPAPDPWAEEVMKYVSSTPEVTCSNTQLSLLYTEYDQLLLNTTALHSAGLARSQLTCGYRYIHLIDADTYTFTPEIIIAGDSVHLSNEYNGVWARCYLTQWWMLDWVLPEIALYYLGVQLYHNILIYVPHIPVQTRTEDQYSVSVLVIDALSQSNFMRSFPLTWAVLRSLQGILFQGHNRVGHNSYPNVMALLSGEITDGIPERKEMYYIDLERQPLLPSVLRQHGYITMHMEDAQNMGDFNRAGVVGFKNPPADIYYRGPFLAIVKTMFALLRNRLVGETDCFACIQEKMQHKYQLPAIRDFIETYKNNPTFSFIHLVEYLHNDLNMAKHYDKDLANMIESLHNSSALKNTFFLLMGDHGYQRSDPPFIFTNQGKTEMNMPLFYLLPPSNFPARHTDKYNNLLHNSQVLTTFFDINMMMREILSLATNIPVSKLFPDFEGHGSSLFMALSARTCEQAEVPEDYCSCLDGVSSLDNMADTLLRLGAALLSDINNHLQDVSYCSELSLSRVENGRMKKAGNLTSLTFLLYVQQREGIFECQVKCGERHGDSCSIGLTRLDWFSKTSGCVPESMARLEPFCICKD